MFITLAFQALKFVTPSSLSFVLTQEESVLKFDLQKRFEKQALQLFNK